MSPKDLSEVISEEYWLPVDHAVVKRMKEKALTVVDGGFCTIKVIELSSEKRQVHLHLRLSEPDKNPLDVDVYVPTKEWREKAGPLLTSMEELNLRAFSEEDLEDYLRILSDLESQRKRRRSRCQKRA